MTKEEHEQMKKLRVGKSARRKRLKQKQRMITLLMLLLIVLLVIAIICLSAAIKNKNRINLSAVQIPNWITQEYLEKNPYSRPGTKLKSVDGIVVHYTANPGTSAIQNRNYFNSLANQTKEEKISVSSHFIIGIDGEIIQCIPLDELSYASNERNIDTISIECCHPDATGEFADATYQSLIKLTSWLCEELKLKEREVIRHYDVTGKKCPLYYVDHEDKWKDLKKEIKKFRKENYKKGGL